MRKISRIQYLRKTIIFLCLHSIIFTSLNLLIPSNVGRNWVLYYRLQIDFSFFLQTQKLMPLQIQVPVTLIDFDRLTRTKKIITFSVLWQLFFFAGYIIWIESHTNGHKYYNYDSTSILFAINNKYNNNNPRENFKCLFLRIPTLHNSQV